MEVRTACRNLSLSNRGFSTHNGFNKFITASWRSEFDAQFVTALFKMAGGPNSMSQSLIVKLGLQKRKAARLAPASGLAPRRKSPKPPQPTPRRTATVHPLRRPKLQGEGRGGRGLGDARLPHRSVVLNCLPHLICQHDSRSLPFK